MTGHKRIGLDTALRRLTGGDTAAAAQRDQRCLLPPIGCGQPVAGFADRASRDEYRLTGLCQRCQDEIEEAAEQEEHRR